MVGSDFLLEIDTLSVSFGGLKALDGYHLRLPPASILGIIGPNGAGKTTLFNTITGFIKPDSGRILFEGRDITGRDPHKIARGGIARSFQNICLFGKLSVLNNVITACQIRRPTSLAATILRTPSFKKSEKALGDRAMEILTFFGLEDLADRRAMNLSYGDQRRLEIARALATSPKLLMIDEPAAGMNPKETQDLLSLILKLKEEFKLTIILIEHNMNLVMPLCETIQVLNYGKLVAEGPPSEIQANPDVIDAYLGSRS